ncbi:MAG: DUF4142 domain-containing protein [Acetobacteraceae bacterium]|nr:DUF4142 domain-containing protein [Acetobacteraceae bacterium]
MQGLSGSEFDHQYIEHMVQDHEKTIPLFERLIGAFIAAVMATVAGHRRDEVLAARRPL